MGKVVWLVVFLLFGAIGAGARYAVDLFERQPMALDGLFSLFDPAPAGSLGASVGAAAVPGDAHYALSGERISGPVLPQARPAPAAVHGPMEGLAPADQYPLSQWSLDRSRAGEVTQAFIAGQMPAPVGSRPLAGDDVLLLSGWAGDPVLGLRFSQVVFSLCGKVVGWADVRQPRPDVVRYIHPNLAGSGWVARLPVALLPRCPASLLQTWAAAPMGVLYPLSGPVPIPLLPPSPATWAPKGRDLLRPSDMPRLRQALIDVRPGGAIVRRCPQDSCQEISMIQPQTLLAARLDLQGRWTLLMTDQTAGWVENQQFRWWGAQGPPPGLPTPEQRPDQDALRRMGEDREDRLEQAAQPADRAPEETVPRGQ